MSSHQPTCQRSIQEVPRDRSRRRGRGYPEVHGTNKTLTELKTLEFMFGIYIIYLQLFGFNQLPQAGVWVDVEVVH